MPAVLVEAGAVRALLPQLDLARPFEYGRSPAASTLAGLCGCQAGREEVRDGGGIAPLKALVLQREGSDEEGSGGAGHEGEHAVRFDQRDASAALLALRATPEELAAGPPLSLEQLRRYAYCSHAWLLGRAASPTEGYSEEEEAARVPQLAAGEEVDSEGEEAEWEAPQGEQLH